MAEIAHMHPDLVGAASFQFQFNKAQQLALSFYGREGFIMGAGFLALGGDFPQDDAGQGPGNGGVDKAFWRLRSAFYYGQVFPVEEWKSFVPSLEASRYCT